MIAPDPCIDRVQALDWCGLRALWADLRAGSLTDWPSGLAFEYLVLRAFELDGADVVWPFRVELYGEVVEQIDGLVFARGRSCLLECKDERVAVNIEPIAKLRNQLMRRPAGVIGAVFSRNGFTEPAKVLSAHLAPQTVLLWDGAEIGRCLERQSIVAELENKFRVCVKTGRPDYNLIEEDTPWARTSS